MAIVVSAPPRFCTFFSAKGIGTLERVDLVV